MKNIIDAIKEHNSFTLNIPQPLFKYPDVD